MKLIHKVIKGCADCLYGQELIGGKNARIAWCSMEDKYIDWVYVAELPGTPQWCPLPDEPQQNRLVDLQGDKDGQ